MAYRDAFLGRLQVLANAEVGMFSADGNALAALVRLVLAPYRERIVVEPGPRIVLNRQQVRPLSMVLHELATNSLKYGALSAEGGRVHIGWTETGGDAPRLSFTWREEGGPAVSQPKREGFGTKLIRTSVGMDLGGSVDFSFAPGGVDVRIDAPLKPPLEIP